MKYSGSCLCRKVLFVIEGEIKAITHCHCRDCQKSHSAAFATFAAVQKKNFTLTGEEYMKRFTEPEGSTRLFCSVCGSSVLWLGREEEHSDWISFSLALLDSEFAKDKRKHVWVSDKAPWYEILDHYPQYQ